MFVRKLGETINSYLNDNKAILIFGARQTGKTTLLRNMFGGREDVVWLYGDNRDTHMLLEGYSATRYKTLFAPYKLMIIDEAQNIGNIGKIIKIFTDQIPEIKVIATGSSAFDLANKTAEPLTGRKWELQLYPLSFAEMCQHHQLVEELKQIPFRMLYGYYPEVLNNPGREKEVLKSLTDSYLYKDLLIWSNIKHSDMLVRLLQLLALQIGNEVSHLELSQSLGIDRGTVERYLDVLEKTYIIFRLNSFSRNHRNELKKAKKVYFCDNGLRNALIANFAPLNLRNDTGALWENFLLSERRKLMKYNNIWSNTWFWRTTTKVEIDYLEDHDGQLSAYEFKWNPLKNKTVKPPESFMDAYPGSKFNVITPQNIETFLL
jgi:uncharacterized protein